MTERQREIEIVKGGRERERPTHTDKFLTS